MSDELSIPAFLDRRKYDAEGILIKGPTPEWVLHSGAEAAPRVWAPIKSASEARRKNVLENFYAEKPELPVQVVTTDRKNLNSFDNFDAFKKFHDFDDYPVKKVMHGGDTTYVQVKVSNTAVLSDVIKEIPKVYHTVVKQNGIKRPKTDSLCGRAWALYDQTLSGTRTIAEAMEMLKQGGMNGSTVRTQFAHWRTFNGIEK